jgi:hypothetical protein
MTRIPLALLLLSLLQACGGDDDSPSEPPVVPSLGIARFATVGGEEFEPDADCVEVSADADHTLFVELRGSSATTIGDWLLRPPGSCRGEAACGHLQVRVDPEVVTDEADPEVEKVRYALQATGATTTLALPFARPCPQTASADECVGIDELAGEHTIEITLRDDDGFIVFDDDLNAVQVTATVNLAQPGGC